MNIKYFDIASTNFNQNFPPLSQTVKEELIENEEIPQITEKPEEIQESYFIKNEEIITKLTFL